VFHDHATGTTRTDVAADPLAVLRSSPQLTARGLASILFNTGNPDRNQVERARRRLEAFVREGLAICVDGHKGGIGGGTPTVYVAAADDHDIDHPPPPRPGEHDATSSITTGHPGAGRSDHATDHADHAAEAITFTSLYEGGT
jgi:hypothetical protein